MSLKWYSVKTFLRSEIHGKPIAKDEHYDSSVTLIEERVQAYKAESWDDVIFLAESESLLYVKDAHIKPYGQRVTQRLMAAINVYEMFEQLPEGTESGLEIYSNTFLISKDVEDDSIIDMHFGNEDVLSKELRKNIFNREFSGIVGDIEEHRKIVE